MGTLYGRFSRDNRLYLSELEGKRERASMKEYSNGVYFIFNPNEVALVKM